MGGLLVAVAAVGTFAAWSGANRGPGTEYVVATHTIAPGAVIERDDVKTVAMDLPRGVAARSYSSSGIVINSVTLGPLAAGELIQASNVLPAREATPRPELSFGIDAERAVAGSLRPGDRVDILVTYGTGSGSVTQLVSRQARVLAIDGGARNGLSDARRQILTVSLASTDEILALTNAARAGEVTVSRSSGVAKQPSAPSFQPRGPDSGGGTSTSTSTSVPARTRERTSP